MTGFICHQKTFGISSQSLSGVDNPVLWTLTDGNNHAVSGVKGFASGNFGETAFFILGHILKDYSFICDFHRSLVVFKLNSLQLGIAEFMVAGCHLFCDGKAGQIAYAFSDGGSCHIHSGIPRSDHNNPFAQAVTVRIIQIIDSKVYMSQRFAFDMKGIGLPYTGSYENSFIAVAEEVVNTDCPSDMGVWPEFDAFQIQMAVFEIVQNRLWKAEFRNAVAQYASDLVLTLKDSHIIAVPCQNHCDGQAGRAGADDRCTDAV